MKKYLLPLTIFPMLLTGCGYSFEKPSKDIEPIENVKALHDVCIYKDSEGFTTYDDGEKLILSKLDSLSISYRVTTKDELANCPYTLSHDIKRSGVPLYLANMEVYVNDSQKNLMGSIQYYYRKKGLNVSAESMKGADNIINKLLDDMFQAQ